MQSFTVQNEADAGHLRRFVRFGRRPRPKQRLNLVEVLHQGKYTLLKRYGRQLHRAGDGPALNGDTNNERLAELYA